MNKLLKPINNCTFGESLNNLVSSKRCCYFTVITILLFLAYFFIRLPILSTGDTDLWYHLSGGRYFLNNFKISQSGFFSFIAEQREWSNYYWQFQVIVCLIYKISGYYGLIIFKTFIFILTVSIIAFFLFKHEKNNRKNLYITIIFICLSIGLLPRYFNLMRPHIFSYLFIPVCIYLLEFRSRHIYLLPFIAIIWANTHGVEYPVLTLICLAYFIELYAIYKKNREESDKKIIFHLGIIAVTLCAILINPYFNKLLTAPFDFAKYQYQYISEIQPISLPDFLTFKFYPIGKIPWVMMNILILISCIGAVRSLLKRDARVSHLLMLIGGIYLLTRSSRFQYEAVLLSLPILKYQPLTCEAEKNISENVGKTLLAATFLIFLSFFFLYKGFDTKARYPFSHSNYPSGTASFLNFIDTGGTVLNNPNFGGYLQWELDPKYKIAMDLQMVLFSDEDFFTVKNALSNKAGFTFFKNLYNPDFIIESRENIEFKNMIKEFSEYKPVFFDYATVLYANIESKGQELNKYELNKVDPYNIFEVNFDELSEEKTDALLNELLKIHKIYPEGMLVNFQIGRIYMKKGDYISAHKYTETIIKNYPETPYGYTLNADILMKQGLYDKSILLYKKALKRPEKWDPKALHKKLALAYSKINEHKNAYRNMKQAVEVFSPSADYNDIWMLGNMAILCGEYEDGKMYLKFSMIKAPEEDEAFLKRVKKQIDGL